MTAVSVLLVEHDGCGGEWVHAVRIRRVSTTRYGYEGRGKMQEEAVCANVRSTWRGRYTKKFSNICRYVRSGHITLGVGSTAGSLACGKETVRTTVHFDRLEEEVGGTEGGLCGARLCCGPGGWGSSHVPCSGIGKGKERKGTERTDFRGREEMAVRKQY